MHTSTATLDTVGAHHFPAVISDETVATLRATVDGLISARPGIRVQRNTSVTAIAGTAGALGQIAARLLGRAARPVRAVLFDKSARNNWVVPWHQDRTIAVRERGEATGYGPWSRKAGIWHVEPPFDLTARMVTLRAHLDDCGADNAPLLYVAGSHKLGRLPAEQIADLVRQQGHAGSLAKAGDVWAYATAIVHGSDAARKPNRRRVLQIDYSADELPAGLEWAGI